MNDRLPAQQFHAGEQIWPKSLARDADPQRHHQFAQPAARRLRRLVQPRLELLGGEVRVGHFLKQMTIGPKDV